MLSAGKRLTFNLRGGTSASDAQLKSSYNPLTSGVHGSAMHAMMDAIDDACESRAKQEMCSCLLSAM